MNSLRTLLGVGVHFLPKVALVTIGRFKIRECVIPISPQFKTAAEPREPHKIQVLRGRLLPHGIETAISGSA
jgi:hypothetical protein